MSPSDDNILDWSPEKVFQNIKLVFSQLKLKFSSEDLEENNILFVCFALEHVFQHLNNDDATYLLSVVAPIAEHYFFNTLEGLVNFFKTDSLTQSQLNTTEECREVLFVCCSILKTMEMSLSHIQNCDLIKFEHIQHYARVILKIIFEAFLHLKNVDSIYRNRFEDVKDTLMEFFKQSSSLQTQCLEMVTSKAQSSDKRHVSKSFELIISHAEECLKVDTRALLEAWKCLLRMLELHGSDLSTMCVLKATLALLNNMKDTINLFLKSNHTDLKKSVNTLKRLNFLLKCVIKIWKFLDPIPAYKELLNILFTLYRSTPTYLRASGMPENVVGETTRLLVIGADPVLSMILTESHFREELKKTFVESCQENPYGSIILLLTLLKKFNTSGQRKESTCYDYNLINAIFISLGNCHDGISTGLLSAPGSAVSGQTMKNTDLYEWVFTRVAVHVTSLTRKEFPAIEKVLFENVVQANPLRAMLACDLWCMVARYAKASLCHGTLDALIPALDNLDLNFSRPELVHLCWLIRRLFPLCGEKYQQSIFERFPPREHPVVWRVIGWKIITLQNIAPDLFNTYIMSAMAWIEGSDISDLQFQNTISSLHAASFVSNSEKLDSSIFDSFLHLWAINPPGLNSNLAIDLFLNSISIATANSVSHMPPHIIASVLNSMIHLLTLQPAHWQKLAFLKILENMTTVDVLPENTQERLSDCFREILSSNSTLLQVLALKSFSDIAHTTAHSKLIELTVAKDDQIQKKFIDFLEKKLPKISQNETEISISFHHKCPIYHSIGEENICDYNPKRQKLDNDGNTNLLIREGLARIENDCNFIVSNASRLSQDDRQRVRLLCKKLSNI